MPEAGKTVVNTIETSEYTASIKYYNVLTNKETTKKYLFDTRYKAVITITPKEGFTTIGIPENGYTLDGLTSTDVQITNDKNSMVVTATFSTATAKGMFVTIGDMEYAINSLDPTTYASLPSKVSYDATRNYLVLNGYNGTAIYSNQDYSDLNIYLIGRNTLSGAKVSTDFGEILGLGTKTGNIIITGEIGSSLDINITDNNNIRGIFISNLSGNFVSIISTIVNINITQNEGNVTAGVYGSVNLMGTGRLNINVNSTAHSWINGILGSFNMTSTSSAVINANGNGKAVSGSRLYIDENYYIDNDTTDYLKLLYKGTYSLSLNTMPNGTAILNPTGTTQSGQTVSITNIVPNTGFLLKEIKIFDEYSNDVTAEVEFDSSTNTFIMPSYNVKVGVYFEIDTSLHTISKIEDTNGTFVIQANAIQGIVVQIANITPSTNYRLKEIKIYNELDEDITSTVSYNELSKSFVMPAANVKVSVVFELNDYTITKDAVNNGTFNVSETAVAGSTVTVTFNPNSHYELKDIKIYRSSNKYDVTSQVSYSASTKSFVMPNYPVTVEVNYKLIQYIITTDTDTHGTIIVTPRATYNALTTFTATPHDKYKLKDIKIYNESNEDITTLVKYNAEDKTFYMPGYAIKIYATFELINVSVSPVLTVTPNTYNSLNVSWNKVEGAEGYYIYRATSKTGTYITIKTITDGNITSYINSSLSTGKIYYYKVRAYNTNGSGPLSTYKYATVIPEKTTLSLTATSSSAIKISWTRVSGASGYLIYRSTNGTKYSAYKTITSGNTISYLNSNLITNGTYYYKVRAYRTVGSKKIYSKYSNVINSAPYLIQATNLNASNNYYRYVKVSWDKVRGASGYKLYRSESENTGYVSLGYATTNEYYDTTAKEGITYYYRVRPYRKIGRTNYYGKLYLNSCSGVRLEDTITFTATINTYNSNKITIDEVDNATYYYIYRATSKTGTYKYVTKISANELNGNNKIEYIDKGLSFNKTYYYKVRVYYKNASDYTSYKYVKTTLVGKSIVTGSDDYYKYAYITYTGVSGASGYRIYRSETVDGIYSHIGYSTKTYYADTKALVGKTYYYKVKPYRTVSRTKYYATLSDGVGASRLGYTITFNTQSNTYNSNKITIDEVDNATYYYIYRATSKTGTYSYVTKIASSELNEDNKIVYIDKGLSFNKTYYYKVKIEYKNTSDYTIYKYAKTALNKPEINIEGIQLAENRVLITAVPGATGYIIYRSFEDGAYSKIVTTKSLSYDDKELIIGGELKYNYKVVAYRTVGSKNYYSIQSDPKHLIFEPIEE